MCQRAPGARCASPDHAYKDWVAAGNALSAITDPDNIREKDPVKLMKQIATKKKGFCQA